MHELAARTLASLRGQRVAVVGLGKSGLATLRFLLGCGCAEVLGCDDRDQAALAGGLSELGDARHSPTLRLRLGGLRGDLLQAVDLIVLSPGVPPNLPALAAARAAGVRFTGEIELASRLLAAPLVGITGTNGKSTVTSLCGAIAEATGRPSFCGGNLGTPLIAAVGSRAASSDGIVVCELSSYQLETAATLHCRAAAILNLTPDHLDRYPSLAAYGDAKAQIARNQTGDDVLVVNDDDVEVAALLARSLPPQGGPQLYRFSVHKQGPELAAVVVGHELTLRLPSGVERYPIDELQIVGRHNLANAMAAFLLMRAAGLATYAQTRQAARHFQALPHRMQLVAESAGIRYYDDSKGTNVDAVVAGLDGFPRPLALIAGGRDKGGSYAPLRAVLDAGRTRGVVLIGEAAALLAAALAGSRYPVRRAETLEQAVALATALCQPGDAVVLSPACSSFDMFRDYAHRANVFTAAARSLANPVAGAAAAAASEPAPRP
jgi:UDP-N-acetylmuramoylalanine--D-glutamate ligase